MMAQLVVPAVRGGADKSRVQGSLGYIVRVKSERGKEVAQWIGFRFLASA